MPAPVRAATVGEVFSGEGLDLDAGSSRRSRAPRAEEDPYLLLFTSGTTGRPKGVRLAQRAMVHAIDGGHVAVGRTPEDVGLHFLPFAHVAGHAQFALALAETHGLLDGLAARGHRARLRSDRPTSSPCRSSTSASAPRSRRSSRPCPRRSPPSRARRVAAAARVRVDGGRSAKDRALARLADRLVGNAVRAKLGGNVRGLFSGAPPPRPRCSASSRRSDPVRRALRHERDGRPHLLEPVRRPAAAGQRRRPHARPRARFAPDGELLLKGPLLLTGYLDREDDAGAFTEDGFFRTGDIGRIDAEGFLRIDGRKKHLMVLSTGKKVAPEPIEQAIASAAPFEGAVLLGEGRPFVSAAVFVAAEEIARIAAAGKDVAEELLPRARAALGAFSDFEKPRRLLVIQGAPQDHPALVTPTLKLKRDALLAFLGSTLNDLYTPQQGGA